MRRFASHFETAVKKTSCGCCGRVQMGWYDRKIRRVRDLSCGDMRILLELEVRRIDCRSCGKVKQERLGFLADNPFYTKRFGYFVGRRCRQASISDVAKELTLDWHTVKALEMQYMKAQLARAGTPGPLVIGRDCDPQGSYLSDRGQRSCAAPADLVWRRGPIGSEHVRSSTPGSARRRAHVFALQ
jgi:transposase